MKILKKILICIYNLQGGGAERVLINLLDSFDEDKYDVTLLVLRKEGIYLDKIPNKIRVIFGFKTLFGRKISNKVLSFFTPRALYNMFVKGKYDIEISFLEGFATKFISGSTSNSKKIAWVHADFKDYHWTESIFNFDEERNFYSKFDNIICVSKKCAESFKELFGFCDRIKVIYNLLDKSLENYSKINFNDVFKTYKTIKLLYVGRLEKEKAVIRLIRSFKDIFSKGYKNITLFILGDGSLRDELKKSVVDYGIEDNVVFLPFKENVYDYIISSDYVILPSYSESFSLVLAESVYLNKVCISTDTAGAREVLNFGEYGMIVENSQDGLTEGILSFLKNPELKDVYLSKMKNSNYIFRRDAVLFSIFELFELEREG